MHTVLLAGNAYAARILLGYLAHDTRYTVVGCVVDDAYTESGSLHNLPNIPLSEVTGRMPPDTVSVIMAMGYGDVNGTRARFFTTLKEKGYTIETYIHERATILTDEPIGEGCVVMPGVLIEPGATIGKDTFLWGNAVVAHDAKVGDHCWIAAGAVLSGMAKIGNRTFIGVNATISNKVEIGERNIVGGSAFMSKNTKDDMVHLARSGEPFRCTAEEYARYFGL
ncbi:MAG: acetyltransferase [Desulfovibrionaceae bacterium]|nr:acetyltransferase [Desulfovibrionaceae bacterium]